MQAFHRDGRAVLLHLLRLHHDCFLSLRGYGCGLVGLLLVQLIFILSLAAGKATVYYKQQPTGSGGVCTPAVPPPHKCSALKRLPLLHCSSSTTTQ